MAFKTQSQLVQGVLKKVGLVTGTSVQTYTQPQIEASVQDGFDFMFRKRFWEHLSGWSTYALDGTVGIVTTDLTDIIKSLEDIKSIYINGTDQRVVRPRDREHLNISGANPLYYVPYTFGNDNFYTRVIRFYPNEATGSVDIYSRKHPGTFATDSVVPLPSDMLEWCISWLLLETDGINPANAAKCQSMFDLVYQDFVSNMGEDAIGHGRTRLNEPFTIRS